MPDREIGDMRPDEGAPGRAITRAMLPQLSTIEILDVDGSMAQEFAFDRPFNGEHRPRERRGIIPPSSDQRGKPGYRILPRSRNCNAGFRHFAFDSIKPCGIGTFVFKKAVAGSKRALERVDSCAMLRIDGQHQTVEEASTVARGTGKEPVKGGS